MVKKTINSLKEFSPRSLQKGWANSDFSGTSYSAKPWNWTFRPTELCSLTRCQPRQYHFIGSALPWLRAQAYCREQHTDLATVSNMEEMNRLVNTVQDSTGGFTGLAWIGLHDNLTSWRWSFSRDKESQYRNWGYGQPDNYLGDQMCVKMGGFGVWEDSRCFLRNPFVCYDGLSSDFINRVIHGHINGFLLSLIALICFQQRKPVPISVSFLSKRTWAGLTLSSTAGVATRTSPVLEMRERTRKYSRRPETRASGLASTGLQSATCRFVWRMVYDSAQPEN